VTGAEEKPWIWPRAAYVHVPFCAHHCGYCDFAVVTGQDGQISLYLEALGAEMARLGSPQPVDTIFLGGGTPTHLNANQLERLLDDVRRWLPLNPGGEFTVEANPGTLGPDKIAALAAGGVNRVSLGVQSFQPGLLRVLERDHVPEDVPRAVAAVRRCIPQLSLDLIFGAPGQTLAEWADDLARALALGPDHISTYGLTYEKGTHLWKQREGGAIEAQPEETELALYEMAMDTLGAAGFEHYEISNHARPGMRSRHNQVYWANHAYFGFGMGAAKYLRGRRSVNTRELQGYIRKALAGDVIEFQSEELGPEERARETLVMHLRRADGVERSAFRAQTGFDVDALAGAALARHGELGLVVDNGESMRLTRRGKCLADALVQELL
jgi:oxygen-independent coproporphyrinogen-3 oxidase